MKINIHQISFEGLRIEEDISASSLDLETEIINFPGPIKIRAEVSKITNAVNVELALDSDMQVSCSRCLRDFKINLKKNIRLNYQVSALNPVIDLDPDIREEIIIDYPIQPLCSINCKGLCPKCGKNLNEEKCNCRSK